jgi:membrane-associated PAP2 superfamily phosphatase
MGQALVKDWKLQSLIGLLGLALVFVLNRSGMDLALSLHFYDVGSASFPLRDEYLYSEVLHTGLKNFSVLIWLILLLACALMFVMTRMGRSSKLVLSGALISVLNYILVSSFVCASLVAWLKSQSAHSCPWDLTAFGGEFDFFYLGADWSLLGLESGPGKCFPSGHASVGWMWVGVLLVPSPAEGAARRFMVCLKLAVIAMSLTVSITQLVRGAHFVSHVLMTAVICWGVAVLVYQLRPWLFKKGIQAS